jgi:hypothetical protein
MKDAVEQFSKPMRGTIIRQEDTNNCCSLPVLLKHRDVQPGPTWVLVVRMLTHIHTYRHTTRHDCKQYTILEV